MSEYTVRPITVRGGTIIVQADPSLSIQEAIDAAANAVTARDGAEAAEAAADGFAVAAAASADLASTSAGTAVLAASNAAASELAAAAVIAMQFDDVAAFLADTTLTYTGGAPASVVAGDYVRTKAEGFSYEVAASAATDHDVTTAGGVKLYVVGIPTLDTRAFGGTPGVDSVTLNVPARYTTINAAFAYLANKTIAKGTVVEIRVADGTYTLTAGINANHPQGSQIRLIGNETTPANCVITVSGAPTFDALAVSDGNVLGYLNGFRFTLTTKAEVANNFTAVLANNGARIICGPNMQSNNWYYGFAARNGSFMSCPSAVVTNGGDVGIWAFVGSTVYCPNASSTGCSDAVNPWGFGIQAEYGSTVDCSGATASGNKIGGIASLSNSNVRALNCTASSNTGSGFFVRDGGTIEAHGSTASSNTRFGVERIASGEFYADTITRTGNSLGAENEFAYFDNSATGARLAFQGIGRVASNNTDSIFFDTGGGAQFEVSHTASAVNRLAARGGAAGAPARITATGSDTNIDIALTPKGTGGVRLAPHLAGSVTVNGYIVVRDLADGAEIRIPCQRI